MQHHPPHTQPNTHVPESDHGTPCRVHEQLCQQCQQCPELATPRHNTHAMPCHPRPHTNSNGSQVLRVWQLERWTMRQRPRHRVVVDAHLPALRQARRCASQRWGAAMSIRRRLQLWWWSRIALGSSSSGSGSGQPGSWSGRTYRSTCTGCRSRARALLQATHSALHLPKLRGERRRSSAHAVGEPRKGGDAGGGAARHGAADCHVLRGQCCQQCALAL